MNGYDLERLIINYYALVFAADGNFNGKATVT